GNPHAAFDVAGTGNGAWSRCCDTSQPKGGGNREHKLRPKPARQSPTLLIGGTMETAASFEVRNPPSSYPTPPVRAFPLRRRSYWLMRRSRWALSSFGFKPRSESPCRL